MHPIIGIVACARDRGRQFVSEAYIQAVEMAGGVPVLIPCTGDSSHFPRYYSMCDGFLFCGGDDISPRLFGEDLLTEEGRTDEETDLFHLAFMKYALSTSLPVLAICRGMQVMNITRGGSIWQDISLKEGTFQNHMQLSEKRSDVCHRISCSQNSMLYDICGNFIDTNSFHHQCIKTVGQGLKIAALAADGVIEALEDSSASFVIGVQWHPECMYSSCPPMRDLFLIFTEHAKKAKSISLPISFS